MPNSRKPARTRKPTVPPKVAAPVEQCSTCRFFRWIAGTDSPACHRFPEHARVGAQHWCGEFVAK